jgi:hypothetical protein
MQHKLVGYEGVVRFGLVGSEKIWCSVRFGSANTPFGQPLNVIACIRNKSVEKLNCKPPSGANRTQNRTGICTQNHMRRDGPVRDTKC